MISPHFADEALRSDIKSEIDIQRVNEFAFNETNVVFLFFSICSQIRKSKFMLT